MQLIETAPSRYVLLVVADHDLELGSGAIATEVVRCPTVEAAAAALTGGRRYSAVVGTTMVPELAAVAGRAGVPALVVTPGTAIASLAAVAVPVPRADQPPSLGPAVAGAVGPDAGNPDGGGRLLAFCGPGGTGTSVVAAAFTPTADATRVLLADLALRADQAYLHGVADPASGLMDLVAAARYRAIGAGDVRRHTLALARGRLLPGLRRPAHWTAVAPAAFDAVLAAVLASYDLVVADVTGDLEGEHDTGSIDVEERNHMARRATGAADVVVAVGAPGPHGARRLALLVDDLLDHGVDPARIQPVVNRCCGGPIPGRVCGLPAEPIELPAIEGGRLPPAATAPLGRAIACLLSARPAPSRLATLVPIAPGSLGCRNW